MEKEFAPELMGTTCEAMSAKQQIDKYFKRYGDSERQDAKKHQLMFASKIMCTISKCENKHMDIYCRIIIDIFSNQLDPNTSVKYWTLYVNCIRYFHYLLVEKKYFEMASLIYKHISSYNNKFQSAENCITYINIYCYQLLLQNSLKAKNQELAIQDAIEVLERLEQLFKDILNVNKNQNFQFPKLLEKVLQWLFPRNCTGTVYQFLKLLPMDKVKNMFDALFTLYGCQTLEVPPNQLDIQEHAKFVIETVYTFLHIDVMDRMHLQLGVSLLDHCRTECRLQSVAAIAELFTLLYDYIKLLCAQKPTLDFQRIYSIRCERFKELFVKYSKMVMNQSWFGDMLVLVFYIHSQLQNGLIFTCFWEQMNKPQSFKSMFQLFVEVMKLAPCISSDTKLFSTTCCTSSRKHIILIFAHLVMASFVYYCQNVNEQDEEKEEIANRDSNLTDYYKETIQNNIILIINHAFKIIDKMDCVTSCSQEIEVLLTRFKQVTVGCKTNKQAGTCIMIFELFLKIKTKIPTKEWPLLLRRLYKTTAQLITDAPNIGRNIQMCYIASMLDESISDVDIGQIRTQISLFYAGATTTTATNEPMEQLPHDTCLTHLHQTTTYLFRPHLEPPRKRLLHWLETQHIIKYMKSNTALLHSLLKSSQSQYDFVIITKMGKLQTYAMAKISSLYKSLKSKAHELGGLSRIEQLTYGHVCAILLNEMAANQKFVVDSKDLMEDQLENLLLRKEMESFTLNQDLKRLKLAWEAFQAFNDFYGKFDSEIISMDNAIIDWEAILDDLASLALCLQLSGYIEHCSQIWLLHYNCARLIQDNYSILRGLAFFCEYSEHYIRLNNINNDSIWKTFKLEDEIKANYPIIIQGLENLANIQRQTYQNYILIVVLQIAHYYARLARYSFSQMLLQYVELKHAELPERRGRYDIIMATMDAIKFRLLWKHIGLTKVESENLDVSRTTAESLLLHQCLLHKIEESLDRFHDFSYVSSNDSLLYSILIIGLVQELAECTANRLCDNFLHALFIATCKCALQSGLALRLVQVLSMWTWINLQMEYVDKAQTKLKIIEYVLGIKNIEELTDKFRKTIDDVQSNSLLRTQCSNLLSSNCNPGMEAMRKMVQGQLSPIKTDKLQLSPSYRNADLKRYFKCTIDTKQNENIEWTFFMVGCLNARLYFLVEDYDQLQAFYENSMVWLQKRKNLFYKEYYKNIQLMVMQHYSNFLRARHQYDRAYKYLQYAIQLCENWKFNIDAVYCVNLQLQLMSTRKELGHMKKLKYQPIVIHNKIRRVLEFNVSPENNEEKVADSIMASSKKTVKVKSRQGVCSSSIKKSSTQTSITSSGSSSGSLEMQFSKPKIKFEICEDSIEIIEFNDSTEDENEKIDNEVRKCVKRIKMPEKKDQNKNSKGARKTTKSTKSSVTKTASDKSSRPQQYVNIDLINSPENSPTKSPAETLLETIVNTANFNTNELITQMENLQITNSKKDSTTSATSTENKTKTKSGRLRKTPIVKKLDTPLIILEDSPLLKETAYSEPSDLLKTSENKSPNEQTTESSSLKTSVGRPRRQRKLVSEKPEQPDAQTILTTPKATVTTSNMRTINRRRQKNII